MLDAALTTSIAAIMPSCIAVQRHRNLLAAALTLDIALRSLVAVVAFATVFCIQYSNRMPLVSFQCYSQTKDSQISTVANVQMSVRTQNSCTAT